MSDPHIYCRTGKLELCPYPSDAIVRDIADTPGHGSLPTETVEAIEMLKGGEDKGAQVLRIRSAGIQRVIKVYDHVLYRVRLKIIDISRPAMRSRSLEDQAKDGEVVVVSFPYKAVKAAPSPEDQARDGFAAEYAAYEHMMRYNTLKAVQDHSGHLCTVPYLNYRALVQVRNSNSTETRYVPAIIMDYVDGTSMDNLDGKAFTDEQRTRIMKAVLKVYAQVLTAGVYLKELSPKDIILHEESSDRPRATIVGFTRAITWGAHSEPADGLEELRNRSPCKLLNPTIVLRANDLFAFKRDGWLASEYELARDWLDDNIEKDGEVYTQEPLFKK